MAPEAGARGRLRLVPLRLTLIVIALNLSDGPARRGHQPALGFLPPGWPDKQEARRFLHGLAALSFARHTHNFDWCRTK